MRGWLREYRRGGFHVLAPRVRADHGSARSIPPPVIDLLCQLKEDSPDLSIPLCSSRSLAPRTRAYAAFTFSEGAVTCLSSLEQAVRRRGIRKRLYVARRGGHLENNGPARDGPPPAVISASQPPGDGWEAAAEVGLKESDQS